MLELLSHPLVILAIAWLAAYLVLRFAVRWSPRSVKLYPLGFLVKSDRTLVVLDRLSSAAPRLLRIMSDIGIVLGLVMMGAAIYLLSSNLATYLFAPSQVGPQNIVLPLVIGVTIRLEHLPYMLLALGIILVTHEGMHGLIARAEGLKLKSTGLFLFYVFPGGFVEPDEEEFKNAPARVRARVAAGGSFANLIVGLIALLLILGVFIPAEAGVVVAGVEEGSRLSVNDVIYSVNGIPVNRTSLYWNVTASEAIVVESSRGRLTYELREPVNIPVAHVLRSLGVTHVSFYYPMRISIGDPALEHSIYRLLFWIQLLGVNVAIFNMLPIHFLDGSLLVTSLLEKIIRSERALKGASMALTIFSLSLIALNIGFTFKTFGLVQI
ncbi:MAG: site-2 protease family protein [Nitrososphaerota archaeon]